MAEFGFSTWSGKFAGLQEEKKAKQGDYFPDCSLVRNHYWIMMSVGAVMLAGWAPAPVEVTDSPLNSKMCLFMASHAFRWAALAVAPLFFFKTGSSELASMAAKLQAHISICQPDGALLTVICRVLRLLLRRKADQSRMRSGWAQQTPSEFIWEDRMHSTNKTASQHLLLLLQSSKCIRLYLRNA